MSIYSNEISTHYLETFCDYLLEKFPSQQRFFIRNFFREVVEQLKIIIKKFQQIHETQGVNEKICLYERSARLKIINRYKWETKHC